MLALTIKQPWVWAILSSGKRIENRSWRPKSSLPATIAIHAGASYDAQGAELLEREFGLTVPCAQELLELGQVGAVVGRAIVASVVTQSASMWFSGPLGWQLEHVERCTPIPMRGRLGLWRLPENTTFENVERCRIPGVCSMGEPT